jgi:MFS family permease
MINSITYRQQVTPEHLLGRVNTAGRMLSWGVGWTGGALLAGVLVGQLGLRTTMSAFACVNLLGVVVASTSPLRRTADERPIWNEIPDSETVP